MSEHEFARVRRDKVAELTRQGHSAAEIAAFLGICTRTVIRARRYRGCAQPRPPRLTEVEWDTAKRLLDDGASYTEVGRTIGHHGQTISRHFPGYAFDSQHRAEVANLGKKFAQLERELRTRKTILEIG